MRDRYEHVGITATRQPLSTKQADLLHEVLLHLRVEHVGLVFHHGDCTGGDDAGAEIADRVGYRVVCHPPVNPRMRALAPSHEAREPLPYMDRNRALVNECSLLVGCPSGERELQRSGTWATIRYARAIGLALVVIGPNGTVVEQLGISCRW